MKRNISIIVFVLFVSIVLRAQSVEIYFGNPVPSECGTLAVPVLVSNFSKIGTISLKLNFDHTILKYQRADLQENIASAVYNGNNDIGEFALSFFGEGITFQEGKVLFVLHFNIIETSEENTKLKWDDDLLNGNCEFAGPGGEPVYEATFLDQEIQIYNELIASIFTSPILCNGGVTELTVSATGGKKPYVGTGVFSVSAGKYNYIVTDENGCKSEVSISITEPEPLQINSLTISPSVPVQINSNVELIANFTDNYFIDVNIDWGDGTFSSYENIKDGVKKINHVYNQTGVNTVKTEIKDKCGNSVSHYYDYVVVYDPSAGFVTGGGWIMSPEGAYVLEPSITGKANFGFVSKYQKGKSLPEGKTEFQFHSAGMNFASINYEWLVVTGSSRAQFKGNGTINGKGNFGFILTAFDGDNKDTDKFRIKIWDKNNCDAIVYDNKIESELGFGSIRIHHVKFKSEEIVTNHNSIHLGGLIDFKVYPNPFSEKLFIKFTPLKDSRAIFELYNVTGKLVETVFDNQVIGGIQFEKYYQYNFDQDQIFIYRLSLNDEISIGKLVYRNYND